MKNIISSNLELLNTNKYKYILTGLGALSGFSSIAQSAESTETMSTLSLFANPLFDVLLGVIILLIIGIAILAGVLKSVAEVHENKKKSNNVTIISGIVFSVFAFSDVSLFAQSNSEYNVISSYVELPNSLFYLMLIVIAFEIVIIGALINGINIFTAKKVDESIIIKEEPSFFEVMNASVAIENEQDIMLDHNYDGIQELDNDLPPWWKYGFYLTILVAILYLFYYHVIGAGLLQTEEYNQSIQMANVAKEEYQKMNANNVNESSVTMLTDKAEIEKGGTIYKENCFACHGKSAEGGVGPNLTDDYWIHGGSIKDIFISVKYGWPDKGMKSWQADFSPIQIHQITSYIKTLRGSNPANSKAAQGDLYSELILENDSLKTDSTAIIPSDSLKITLK